MCDIWRIRNPNTKRYTFHQQLLSGYIQRILDYFFISIDLRICKIPDWWFTDWSLTNRNFFFSKSERMRDRGLWKHKKSLCDNSGYINSMKNIYLYIYLRKPHEWKFYWWPEGGGIFKMRNNKIFKSFF